MSRGQALDLLPSHQHLSDGTLTVRDMIVAMAADARMDHENPAALHPLLRRQLCTLILRLQLSSNGSRPEGEKTDHDAAARYERFKPCLRAAIHRGTRSIAMPRRVELHAKKASIAPPMRLQV